MWCHIILTWIISAHISAGCQKSVAVCFYGLTRSLRNHTYNSIYRNLLAQLSKQGYQLDIYLHTYNMSKLNNPRSNERNVALDPDEWRLLEPLRYLIEDASSVDKRMNLSYYTKFGNPWRDDPSGLSLRNHLRALNSIETCFSLIEQYMDKYKYIVFARPDVAYVRPLPNVKRLITNNQTIGVKFIDRFAIGSPIAVRKWAHRLHSADAFLHSKWDRKTHRERSKGLHSENLVKFHLFHSKLTMKEVSGFCFVRVRAGGCFSKLDCRACHFSSTNMC